MGPGSEDAGGVPLQARLEESTAIVSTIQNAGRNRIIV
jgi:hypothetical protein